MNRYKTIIMRQETSSENSESMEKALSGLKKIENHLVGPYVEEIRKLRPEQQQREDERNREKSKKLNFLKSFKEKLQAGTTIDLKPVFTMYFEMLVADDGEYNDAELKEFMGSLIIAAKESGAYFIQIPNSPEPSDEEKANAQRNIATSIQETREKFGL